MLTYTLVADGSSDECLMPIIDWTFGQLFPTIEFSGAFATDLPSPRHGLRSRVLTAQKLFPCNLLFIHRDSENQNPNQRHVEIMQLAGDVNHPIVPIVPIRMTEAWLLTSKNAIRKAAGNPNGDSDISIPSIKRLEAEPDPKETLFKALRDAANLGARQMAKFDVHSRRRRVAECISDYTDLRKLPSFHRFENALQEAVADLI